MHHVKQQNWLAVWLDLLVVIFGIFIGLQVTAWNSERNDKHKESEYLREIQKDLASDIEQIGHSFGLNAEKLAVISKNIKTLLMNKDEAAIAKELAEDMNSYSYFSLFRQSRTAFDNLTTVHSIDLIKSSELKKQLIEYYSRTYILTEGTQTQVAKFSREFGKTTMPIIMNKETLSTMFEQDNAWPEEVGITLEDKKYILTSLYYLEDNIKFQNETLEYFLDDAKEITAAIDERLSGR